MGKYAKSSNCCKSYQIRLDYDKNRCDSFAWATIRRSCAVCWTSYGCFCKETDSETSSAGEKPESALLGG